MNSKIKKTKIFPFSSILFFFYKIKYDLTERSLKVTLIKSLEKVS